MQVSLARPITVISNDGNRYEFSPSATINDVPRDETKELDKTAALFWKVAVPMVKTMSVGFLAGQKEITFPCKEYAEQGSGVDGLFCKETAQRLVKRIQPVTREIPQSRGFTILLHDNYERVSPKMYFDLEPSTRFHRTACLSSGLLFVRLKPTDNDFTRSPIFKTMKPT